MHIDAKLIFASTFQLMETSTQQPPASWKNTMLARWLGTGTSLWLKSVWRGERITLEVWNVHLSAGNQLQHHTVDKITIMMSNCLSTSHRMTACSFRISTQTKRLKHLFKVVFITFGLFLLNQWFNTFFLYQVPPHCSLHALQCHYFRPRISWVFFLIF